MNPTKTTQYKGSFLPGYDNKIWKKYSSRTLEGKLANKLAFQKELGWIEEKRTPILCLPAGMTDTLGGETFEKTIEGIFALPCQLLVRGIGSEKYGRLFTKLQKEYQHRVKILKDDDVLRRKMYAASDMALFFVNDEGELHHCLAYGAVPIAPENSLLTDYDPIQESGNAFLAGPDQSPWKWFAALVRAIETYKLPYDFRTIQRHAMETVKDGEA